MSSLDEQSEYYNETLHLRVGKWRWDVREERLRNGMWTINEDSEGEGQAEREDAEQGVRRERPRGGPSIGFCSVM